jgi:hypothetical protein
MRRPKHFGFPLNPQPCESEILNAVFQSEWSFRGEPVESCKLCYFNSLEFFEQEKLLFRQDREDYCVRCGGIVAQFDVQTGFGWMRNAQSGVDEAYGYWRRVGELLV